MQEIEEGTRTDGKKAVMVTDVAMKIDDLKRSDGINASATCSRQHLQEARLAPLPDVLESGCEEQLEFVGHCEPDV